MKSEFLSTLSHELRTPLNAILGWAQVLKETEFEAKQELAEAVDVIERNARAQATMIEDLLDVSRIVSGKVMLDIRELDLAKITEAAIQALRPAAAAREIRLTSAFATISPIVMGDEDRVQQVVWNLLSNAIKFTPKGGRVHVTIERVDSHIEIAVADNGLGIKPEFLPHVFERFRQADASTKRQFGGLGLGLSIVKHLMELHGGDVRASSLGEGLGSTFTISLPVMPARRPEAIAPGAGAPVDEDAAVRQPLLNGVEVLVVDDEPDSLALIKRILSGRGARVQTAASVKEALRLLESYSPDLLLSDISMPEQDGYDLIRRVRDLPVGHLLPAVAVTAMARSEDRTRALKAGFQTHIAKPVEPAELVAVVASFALLRRSKRS
jgi:CheY-like chemotaxis protein